MPKNPRLMAAECTEIFRNWPIHIATDRIQKVLHQWSLELLDRKTVDSKIELTAPLGALPPVGRRWEIGRTVVEIEMLRAQHEQHEDTPGCPICDDYRRGDA